MRPSKKLRCRVQARLGARRQSQPSLGDVIDHHGDYQMAFSSPSGLRGSQTKKTEVPPDAGAERCCATEPCGASVHDVSSNGGGTNRFIPRRPGSTDESIKSSHAIH